MKMYLYIYIQIDEKQDVTIVNKKLTNKLHKIAKKIARDRQVKQ